MSMTSVTIMAITLHWRWALAVGIDAVLSVGDATLGNGTELLLLAAVRLLAVILCSGDDLYLRR